jgi:hypothetical protein
LTAPAKRLSPNPSFGVVPVLMPNFAILESF